MLQGQLPGPTPQSSKSVNFKWSLGICIFHEFLYDFDADDCRPEVGEAGNPVNIENQWSRSGVRPEFLHFNKLLGVLDAAGLGTTLRVTG